MPNEAIERAAKAALETVMPDGDYFGDWLECMDDDKLETAKLFIRAAISAYFADVPVSEGMVVKTLPLVGEPSLEERELAASACMELGVVDANGISAGADLIRDFKAMCRQHAEELSNGR